MLADFATDASKPQSLSKPDLEKFRMDAYRVPIAAKLTFSYTAIILKRLEKASHHPRVLIEINSVGGSVCYAESIIAAITRMRSDKVEVRIIAKKFCLSCAMYILLAVPADCRYGKGSAYYMIHSAHYDGALPGTIKQNLTAVESEMVAEANKTAAKMIVFGSRISEDSLESLLRSGVNASFNSQMALEYGVISGIIDAPRR